MGNVLFWLGIIIAIAWLLLVGVGAYNDGLTGVRVWELPPELAIQIIFVVFVPPTISVAVGWTLRYILAGR